jgi:hypothetical protein
MFGKTEELRHGTVHMKVVWKIAFSVGTAVLILINQSMTASSRYGTEHYTAANKISNFQPTKQIIPFTFFMKGNRKQLFSYFHN